MKRQRKIICKNMDRSFCLCVNVFYAYKTQIGDVNPQIM